MATSLSMFKSGKSVEWPTWHLQLCKEWILLSHFTGVGWCNDGQCKGVWPVTSLWSWCSNYETHNILMSFAVFSGRINLIKTLSIYNYEKKKLVQKPYNIFMFFPAWIRTFLIPSHDSTTTTYRHLPSWNESSQWTCKLIYFPHLDLLCVTFMLLFTFHNM